MRAIIVEDEKLAATELEALIKTVDPRIEIVAILDSVKTASDWLMKYTCELIFLDIHLADGNGFAIFEAVQVNTPVIFTTAFDEYAIRAFQLNSIDYLLKPIELDKLTQAINKLKHQHQLINAEVIKQIERKLNDPKFPERFMVQSGELTLTILVDEVAYFYAQQRYVILCTRKNEQYVIDYTLDKLEQLLNPLLFYRINRQYIIAKQIVSGMSSHTKGRVRLITNPTIKEEVIVSVERSPKFKTWIVT